MRKLILAMALAVVTAAALAALGAAATSSSGPASAAAKLEQAKAKLPALPPEVKARKRWIIGVKCDAPPFGYIDVKGHNAGVDVEIAKWFSRFAFGRENRVSFTCAPTPTREPLLTNDRADLVIATFTYTPDRDTRIDFSRAYYKATGRMLVPNTGGVERDRYQGQDGRDRRAARSRPVVEVVLPRDEAIVFDNFTNARLAFEQGRADTLMFDDTVLLGIATADPRYKLAPDSFLALPYGIGIKQGNVAMKKWVDSRLEIMRKRDQFLKILKNNVANRFIPIFSKNILRPKQNFGYTAGDPSAVCP